MVLDGLISNPGDLTWENIERLGELRVYPHSSPNQVISRAFDADIIITNKVIISENEILALPNLKCICLLATGYNNVDIYAARKRGIEVCNAVGYGTDSVAQHVMAMILNTTNSIAMHNDSVQQNEWSRKSWSYTLNTLTELTGKKLGIYGFGRIGRRVAQLGKAFKMKIIVNHKYPERDPMEDVEYTSIENLFGESDFISLHAPLNDDNRGIVNSELLKRMKPSAMLINTGRGGLINEEDLKDALDNYKLKVAALDVLDMEPPPIDHPLVGLKNCILTPHNAWATQEARRRLIDIVGENIEAFILGRPKNVVN